MEEGQYNPYLEAKTHGIKVKLINFKRMNSLLIQSVVYLRKSMNKIEKRCRLTYELVHYSRKHSNPANIYEVHTEIEEDIIRQETANRLINGAKIYFLLESSYSIDKIAEELQVTKEVIYDYYRYCKMRSIDKINSLEKHPSVVACKIPTGLC
jgi:hypothetical protein